MSKHRHVTHRVSMWLAMPNVTVMSEYTIYMVWKAHSNVLSNNLCHVHLTISKIGCHRLTQQCWHACTNEILEIWKLYILWNNFIKCAWIFLQTFRTDTLYPDNSIEGKNPMLTSKLHMSEIWSESKVEYLT